MSTDHFLMIPCDFAREIYEAGAAYFGLAVPLRGEEDLFNAAESRFAKAMRELDGALRSRERVG